ncbi:MAG: ABC transporter substrate-binding protein [Chloroflexi bacterium]|nr:ABC transporter substrate-binding protein [Chloroflexota bacterium]MBJ7360533.1 ABC transporter substrate-binding protein [Chloroflexota bacterium]
MTAFVRSHQFSFATLLLVAALVSGACGGNATNSLPSVSPTPIVEADYPRTVTDDAGVSVTIAAKPQRIVALTPASVEALAQFGLGQSVVGVAACSCLPIAFTATPQVADYTGTNVEAIISLNPDLVFVGGSGFTPDDAITLLKAANITLVTLDPKSISGVYATLQLIGDAAGASVAAAEAITTAKSDIAVLTALVQDQPMVSVFYEIDATGAIYGLAPDDYAAELVALARGDLVSSGVNGVYEISLEALVTAAPAVILLGDAAYGVTAEAVAARPGWGTIPAVVNGALRPIDGDLVSIPGPRIAEAFRAIVAQLHPMVLP